MLCVSFSTPLGDRSGSTLSTFIQPPPTRRQVLNELCCIVQLCVVCLFPFGNVSGSVSVLSFNDGNICAVKRFFLFLFCFSFFKWKFVNIRSHFDCVLKRSEKFSYFSIVELLLLSVTGRWEGEKRRRRRRPQLTPSMRAIGIILSCFNNNNNQRSKKSSSSVVLQRRRRPL